MANWLTDLLGVNSRLDTIITILTESLTKERSMDAATQTSLANINAALTKLVTIETSVQTLLNGLTAQLAAAKANAVDPATAAGIDAATTIVNNEVAKFQADITANTTA